MGAAVARAQAPPAGLGLATVIDAATVVGLLEGLGTVQRSLGQPASAKGPEGEPPPSAKDPLGSEGCAGLALPPCFLLDAPSQNGRHRRVAVAAMSDVQGLGGFAELQRVARVYQPSHSRTVRLGLGCIVAVCHRASTSYQIH